jgi:phospholipase C
VISSLFRRKSATFDFTMLGGRVPAIVVSPFVPKAKIDSMPRDHASVPATLRTLFAPQAAPLTARDNWSPPFHLLLTLTEPRTTDLPDLSAYVTSSAATPALAASPAPPPLDPDAAPTAEPPMPEHYSELDELTKLVDQKLPGPTQAPATGPRARAQRVTAAFEADASRARMT